ncbi:hypothetical protein GBAR_LOCUS23906 [Geodia barretti]|uniref:Uncharacterized protein n=1 Tax=Geodia barretti TaxID=519541 RepID=A0AA35T7A5_GEOBA|nr:hypothetical protein GBAR_LOCUS23906 [Geodia barretti]
MPPSPTPSTVNTVLVPSFSLCEALAVSSALSSIFSIFSRKSLNNSFTFLHCFSTCFIHKSSSCINAIVLGNLDSSFLSNFAYCSSSQLSSIKIASVRSFLQEGRLSTASLYVFTARTSSCIF